MPRPSSVAPWNGRVPGTGRGQPNQGLRVRLSRGQQKKPPKTLLPKSWGSVDRVGYLAKCGRRHHLKRGELFWIMSGPIRSQDHFK